MLSYRLSRLPFAIFIYLHQFWAIDMISHGDLRELWIVLASIPIVLVFVILPRLRDCDWPQWVGFLTMLPYLGGFIGTGLLFVPSKVINRKADQVVKNDEDANASTR